MNRRTFLGTGLAAAAAAPLTSRPAFAAIAPPNTTPLPPMRMRAGHQHDHSEPTLRALAAFGVRSICSGELSAAPENWTVESLTKLRRHVESFGVTLAAVPLPMASVEYRKAELPALLGDEGEARDRAMARVCDMIRNAGAAGIPMVKYNLTFLGVVRTGTVEGPAGEKLKVFDYQQTDPAKPLEEIGPIDADTYWRRIDYFLQQVVPVAEAAKVRIALHPQDPGLPPGRPYRGIVPVLSTVDGLKRFVNTRSSPYHGLNFCQGTISEMLERPGDEIYDVIRWFGSRGKIFNVHFRNIRGHVLDFQEVLPHEGDVDMPRALRTYREVGYDGMIMPDHVPQIVGDLGGHQAFAFCFGYIQALLQVVGAS